MLRLLQTIKSKYQIQETKVLFRKIIRASGRNIDKNGLCKVYIEIVVFYPDKHKKARLIDTGVKVNPKYWNSRKDDGSITNKDPDVIEKTAKINALYFKYAAQLAEREKGTWALNFNPADLVPIGDLFPRSAKTLINYMDDYVEFRRKQNTVHNTLKEFITCKNRIQAFDDSRNQKTLIEDINISWSDSLEYHLRKKGYMEGTIEKTFTILVTILNHFYERREELNVHMTDKFRSRNFKRGRKSVNDPNPLSKVQLLTLFNHKFDDKHIEINKIRYCLQCFLGVRYSDLFRIRPENMQNGSLRLKPIKTKKYEIEINQPLNDYAKTILKKYDNDTSSLYITNQAYNRSIEDMFKIMVKEYPDLEYRTDYGSHSARDTFITLAVLAGVNWKSILTWVGQSSYTIMNRYIKIVPDHQVEEMKKIF